MAASNEGQYGVTRSSSGRNLPPKPPVADDSTPPPDPTAFPSLQIAMDDDLRDKRSPRRKKNRTEAAANKRPENRSPNSAVPGPAGSAKLAIAAEPTEPLASEDVTEAAIRSAPAWLVSLVFHTSMIILLALLYVAQDLPNVISLDLTYAEQLGQQLDEDTLQSSLLDSMEIEDPAYALDLVPVDNPLAAPPDLVPDQIGLLASDPMQAPSIGVALTGRELGMKKALLAKYGGTARTEAAVTRALEWLKRNQQRDGTWSLVGPYSGQGFDENRTAATAMALLAFQGAGNTHDTGPFKQQVDRGWRALLKMQDDDGNFFREGSVDQRLYSQAQAMIAVCEIYGMTKASQFKQPAQQAIDYAVKIQADKGGWRYRPGIDSDTSVTGWFVMGFQSGLMAGLDVPSPTLKRVSKYLDSVAAYGGSYYKYQAVRSEPSVSMTAEGLLCRQYLGWKRADDRLQKGVDFLLDHPIDWRDQDVYSWYYATQVLHHMEGDAWDRWNIVMREVLPSNQVRQGSEKGSWAPEGDRWGRQGGRLYVTCLCTYMLEVYYRHLPIYAYRLD